MFHLIILLMTLNLSYAEEDEKFKFYDEPKRITGQTCGTTEYTDWPCMDEKGCILIENSNPGGYPLRSTGRLD